jgi:hypothetical protein
MFVVGSLFSNVATGTGFAATAIAVGGFLFHVTPALSGATDDELRWATVVGGLIGFGIAMLVILLSVSID